ncbi:5\'-nucleotidase SurE [Alteracholeplasma palmae J233]|uniref:5'-nucleotidase SurE n=1 Tax=Alteracholeplasma palmae (strain ATCC 49389 / J233) TaxID=1318466 RepID=U4KL28_ALTPJ|nr:5'/3'-nucleotidase SurE [Alteracholeplasma palmae]CCV64447.1 5\'-nucleotidase SurE [Alteracholeplasma palmae J233]
MNILVVNDDGIESEGLKMLVKACAHFGQVYVSAPKYQQSAQSHAMTLTEYLEIEEVKDIIGALKAIKVTGSPVDCVRAGMSIFDAEFDLIVSGINDGSNLGTDILYSGTVAAAMEGHLYHVPAIAFSAPTLDLPYLYDEVIKLLDEMIESELYNNTALLNINFPKPSFAKPLGTKITKQGRRVYESDLVKSDKPNLYHQSFSIIRYQEEADTDVTAYEEGYVSITPLMIEQTDFKKIKAILKNE